MFTGIIESLGSVTNLKWDADNLHITVDCQFAAELKVDQSVSHNGICLTVVAIAGNKYTVTAIRETVTKTNIGEWKVGDLVNLERGMKLGDRLDGHIVQGHVDQTAECKGIEEQGGSWLFTFSYDGKSGNITIEKGSITINGVSLTVVNSKDCEFSVAIIPYTYTNTNFNTFNIGSKVNVEFDVLGKYVSRLYAAGLKSN